MIAAAVDEADNVLPPILGLEDESIEQARPAPPRKAAAGADVEGVAPGPYAVGSDAGLPKAAAIPVRPGEALRIAAGPGP